jgi:hypothetical protein
MFDSDIDAHWLKIQGRGYLMFFAKIPRGVQGFQGSIIFTLPLPHLTPPPLCAAMNSDYVRREAAIIKHKRIVKRFTCFIKHNIEKMPLDVITLGQTITDHNKQLITTNYPNLT